MDIFTAMARAQANSHKPMMVFDWDKAAHLIKQNISDLDYASAGLQGDWEWTGGCIYQDNKPDLESYTYLASCHAIPELILVLKDDSRIKHSCYISESKTTWDAKTKWPQSALDILGSNRDAALQ